MANTGSLRLQNGFDGKERDWGLLDPNKIGNKGRIQLLNNTFFTSWSNSKSSVVSKSQNQTKLIATYPAIRLLAQSQNQKNRLITLQCGFLIC